MLGLTEAYTPSCNSGVTTTSELKSSRTRSNNIRQSATISILAKSAAKPVRHAPGLSLHRLDHAWALTAHQRAWFVKT